MLISTRATGRGWNCLLSYERLLRMTRSVIPPIEAREGGAREEIARRLPVIPGGGYREWISTKASVGELLVDGRSQLVETVVDRHFLGDHLLERFSPQRGDVEEQRLRREVDLRTGR
jgi:hypothetical protein